MQGFTRLAEAHLTDRPHQPKHCGIGYGTTIPRLQYGMSGADARMPGIERAGDWSVCYSVRVEDVEDMHPHAYIRACCLGVES